MSREEEDLATHVAVCSVRYQGIQEKFDNVDQRLTVIEHRLIEIKDIINHQGDRRYRATASALATVIAAFLALLGYVVTHQF